MTTPQSQCTSRSEIGKDVARIYYSWRGNAHPKNRQWCLLDSKDNGGELIDYGSVKHLIRVADAHNLKWQVERWSKKNRGQMTVVKKNYD